MGNKKKLQITCINKIKYESEDEFKDSIFKQVYDNAIRLIRRIIEENEHFKAHMLDEEYCGDEQFNNIIAFMGGRGMGKSSAMLSFALFLKNYKKENSKIIFLRERERQPIFYVLPRVDVGMLIKGENILDIILAKMWDEFEKRNSDYKEVYVRDLKEYFQKVKKSYEIYRLTISGKDNIQNKSSIRELHDLAACLNLRKAFKTLIDAYLRCMNNKGSYESGADFLVISIDDLDVSMGDVYGIMEQIHMFLMLPNVIVLLTADVEWLSISCNKEISEKILCPVNVDDSDRRQIRKYVRNYIAKILPSNMRIDMPDLSRIGSVDYEILMEKYLSEIYERDIEKDICFDEKKLLLVLYAKYFNILFAPFNKKRHYLQKDSLRRIVNNLHRLLSVLQQAKEDQFDQACQWYIYELEEIRKNETNDKLRDIMEYLIQEDENFMNQSIMGIVTELYNELYNEIHSTIDTLHKSEFFAAVAGVDDKQDYGQILKMIFVTAKINENISKYIILLYSLLIERVIATRELNKWKNRAESKEVSEEDIKHGKSDERIRNICKEYIFTPILSLRGQTEKNGIFWREVWPKKKLNWDMEIIFPFISDKKKRYDIAKMISNANEKIMEIFRYANLFDEKIWLLMTGKEQKFEVRNMSEGADIAMDSKEESANKKEEKTKSIRIGFSGISTYSDISMDSFFFNALNYEEHLKGFLKTIYIVISNCLEKKVLENQVIDDISALLEEESDKWNVIAYRKWKEDYDVHSIIDILPLQSTDVIYHLAAKMPLFLKKKNKDQEDSGFKVDIVGSMYQRFNYIISELYKIEQYYGYSQMGYQSYADRLKEYMRIINLSTLSDKEYSIIDLKDEFDTNSGFDL